MSRFVKYLWRYRLSRAGLCEISQAMAGYSLGGADMLRRAMGKKKPEEMAKQRSIFVDGAKNEGIDETLQGACLT